MGVLGLRDLFLVAPATSFHHQQQQHQNHHHEHGIISDAHAAVNASAATALGVGVGVFPLLTAPCLAQPGLDESEVAAMNKSYNNGHRNNNININSNNPNYNNSNNNSSGGIHQFWHHQQQIQPHNFAKKAMVFDHGDNSVNLLGVCGGEGGSGSAAAMPMNMASTGAATATCQDCGNQAKKDCIHRRCRTCCKNRSYDCPTHVKSTWVPAARRRERLLVAGGSSGSTSGVKKARLAAGGASQTTTNTSHTSNSNNTPPRSFDASSNHQDASFKEALPRQLQAPAVFRCVRVTALEEGGEEFAYQAAVRIGGHVFKGFLYDQGLLQQTRDDHQQFPSIPDLQLGGGNGNGNSGGNGRSNGLTSSLPMLDAAAAAADVFATAVSTGAFLGGGGSTSYGNQIS